VPEPLDRSDFLLRVGAAVDLQPNEVGEVIEELNSHLSDAAAGWRDAGYDHDDAERRAIRGLGDPAALGQELGKARRERRHLLAAVGGAVFNAVGFGLWAYAFLWVVVGGWGLISLLAAMSLAQAAGWQNGGWVTGPAASIGSVAVTTAWFAWVGWALPWRVARSAKRSVRGVQRAVGLAGFALGSIALWFLIPVKMDVVLALGLPLGPLAFLAAALHAADGPALWPPTTLRQRLTIALAVTMSVTVAGLLTVKPSEGDQSWTADSSGIGAPADGPLLEATRISSWSSGEGDLGFTIGFVDDAAAVEVARSYPSIRAEAWATDVRDGQLVFGPAPIAVTAAATPGTRDEQSLAIDLPRYRARVSVMSFLVALRADGTRVVLVGPDGFIPTPLWSGTLFDWWFGPR
jgi:hypothetical protein